MIMCIQEEIKSPTKFKNGPVSAGIKAGDYMWFSGSLPISPETGKIVSDDFEQQADQCLRNLSVLLEKEGLSMDYILKTTIYLTSMEYRDCMNRVYARYFSEPYPARVVLGVSQLEHDAKIAIEAFAIDTRALEVIMAGECGENECKGKECSL